MFDGPLGVNPQNPGGVRPGRFVQPRSIPLCRRAMFCPAARRCHLPEPGGELGGGSTGSGGVEVLSALMFPNAGRPPRHPDRKRGSNGRPWSVGLLGSLFDIQKQKHTHTHAVSLFSLLRLSVSGALSFSGLAVGSLLAFRWAFCPDRAGPAPEIPTTAAVRR